MSQPTASPIRGWAVAALTVAAYVVLGLVAQQHAGEWQLPKGFVVAAGIVAIAHTLAAVWSAKRRRWALLAPALGAAQLVLGMALLWGVEALAHPAPDVPGVEVLSVCPGGGPEICGSYQPNYEKMLEITALGALLAAGFALAVAGVARRSAPSTQPA